MGLIWAKVEACESCAKIPLGHRQCVNVGSNVYLRRGNAFRYRVWKHFVRKPSTVQFYRSSALPKPLHIAHFQFASLLSAMTYP